jgi:ABC-type uncharacterized transport system permease subunit
MNLTLLGSIASLTYLGSSLLIFREIKKNSGNQYSLYIAWLAVALHIVSHVENLFQYGNINFGFFNTASIVSLLVALMLLIAAISKPVEKLGIAVFPLAAIMLACNMIFPDNPQTIQTYDWKMHTHILSSIIAFSLLNIAAFQAILLAIQDHQLRKHNPKWFIQSLPPLQTMESLLFQMIMMGMIFLSISLLSGAIFVEDLFAQHLGHKTILSILAWIIFCGLLTGRSLFGWRGQTAMRWTLFGFAALLLAYFGSKLVYEFIL